MFYPYVAFIAFHIGSYLETSNQGKEYVSCVIIAESYHFFAKKLVRDLEEKFDLFNSPERTFDIMKTSSFDEFYSKMK